MKRFFPYSTLVLSDKDRIVMFSSYVYVSPTVPALADHCTTGDLKEKNLGLITTRRGQVMYGY